MSDIKKVVLAYSGGLDTSVIVRWLQDTYNCEVVTFTADIGQGEEVEPAREKAKALGVKEIYIEDLREEFVRDYVFPMFRANTIYEGEYLLGTSIARPLISRQLFVCASPDYLTTHGEPHVLSELSHHNCLLGTLEYWRFNEQKLERNIKVSGTLHCNSGLALLDAALKGIGIVQLPDYYVEPYLASGELFALLQNYQHSGEGVWALYPHNRHLSSKVRMLVDYLAEHLS